MVEEDKPVAEGSKVADPKALVCIEPESDPSSQTCV